MPRGRGVDDEARHIVGLVGNDGLLEDACERHVGERVLRRHPLFAGRRRDARELIAAARRRRFRQQRLEVGEDVAAAGDGGAIHLCPRRLARIIAPKRSGWVGTVHIRSSPRKRGPRGYRLRPLDSRLRGNERKSVSTRTRFSLVKLRTSTPAVGRWGCRRKSCIAARAALPRRRRRRIAASFCR